MTAETIHKVVTDAKPTRSAAVWMFDPRKSRDYVRQNLLSLTTQEAFSAGSKSRVFEFALFGEGKPFVWALTPFALNQRLAAQQGTLLVPIDLTQPFENNLAASLPPESGSSFLDVTELRNALVDLHRMNINRTTLFPGLQGFAEDLKNSIFMEFMWSEIEREQLP